MSAQQDLIFTLREQIADRLRNDVLCGRIGEGERLSELKLVERFGVSRTPIREALIQLAYEGLLEGRPNTGLYVAASSPDGIRDLVLQIRMTVETYALRSVYGSINKDDFALWKSILDRQLIACIERDYTAIAEHDVAFHRSIIRRARQRDLETIWNSLVARVRSHILQTQRTEYADPVDIYREHLQIVEVFRDGNIEAAIAALTQNII